MYENKIVDIIYLVKCINKALLCLHLPDWPALQEHMQNILMLLFTVITKLISCDGPNKSEFFKHKHIIFISFSVFEVIPTYIRWFAFSTFSPSTYALEQPPT